MLPVPRRCRSLKEAAAVAVEERRTWCDQKSPSRRKVATEEEPGPQDKRERCWKYLGVQVDLDCRLREYGCCERRAAAS